MGKSINKNNKHNLVHGLSHNKLFYIWRAMKERCNNKKHKYYKHYGGRGISVCDEWEKSVLTFANWANKNGYKQGLQIDRERNNGNYEPSNCRWVTSKQNNQNRRSNKLNKEKVKEMKAMYKSGKYYKKEIAVMYGINYGYACKTINGDLNIW